MRKRLLIYFLTENINPEKERNEIEYLSTITRVVVVSNVKARMQQGVKTLTLRPRTALETRCLGLWSKVCYLLSRIGDTQSDKRFDLRNVYTGNRFTQRLVN